MTGHPGFDFVCIDLGRTSFGLNFRCETERAMEHVSTAPLSHGLNSTDFCSSTQFAPCNNVSMNLQVSPIERVPSCFTSTSSPSCLLIDSNLNVNPNEDSNLNVNENINSSLNPKQNETPNSDPVKRVSDCCSGSPAPITKQKETGGHEYRSLDGNCDEFLVSPTNLTLRKGGKSFLRRGKVEECTYKDISFVSTTLSPLPSQHCAVSVSNISLGDPASLLLL